MVTISPDIELFTVKELGKVDDGGSRILVGGVGFCDIGETPGMAVWIDVEKQPGVVWRTKIVRELNSRTLLRMR